ncbi:MAG: hypothetical protein SH817_11895 [Leptospira sp.]|nr:hypothetical protein [Leptospira sp.]
MKILKRFGITIVAIGILIVSFYAYLGGFQSIAVDEVDFSSTEIAIYLHKGSYQKIGESWDKFDKEWKEKIGEKCLMLSLYFDPPGTPEDELRSVLACDLKLVPKDKLAKVYENFKTFKVPANKALHATFPFKNKMSFMIGPMKVYPQMDKVLNQSGIVPPLAIEIYGNYETMTQIQFLMPKDIKREAFSDLLALFK